MGVAPTGKRIEISYLDFWKVSAGKIEDNWVMVDFPPVLAQLGVDVFGGEGREKYERSEEDATTRAVVEATLVVIEARAMSPCGS